MIIFNNLKQYGNNWRVIEERPFSKEEIEAIEKASIVKSNYGMSVSFLMKSGGKTFIPCERGMECLIGEDVDPQALILLTIEREGKKIFRIREKKEGNIEKEDVSF